MFSGFTLSYQGKVYTTDATPSPDAGKTGLDRLKAEFSEIGALVIRYHIGQGQRAGLLQQIARDDYAANPVEKPAHGKDQQDLFTPVADASQVYRDTRLLEECSHYSLGRGKLLNDRAQPLVHVNTKIHGEQALWDIIHSPVWGSGIALAPQLKNQGFIYVKYPENITQAEYQEINAELSNDDFTSLEENGGDIIKLNSGRILSTCDLTDIEISFDPLNLRTSQSNKLVIAADNNKAPMGWIVSKSRQKCVDQGISDHLMRIIKLAKGGFYELSLAEQQVIQTGLLKNNGMGLFTQNQVFNAMTEIFVALEMEYGFDPSALLPSRALALARKRIDALIAKDGGKIIEDFLTGILVTEMVQHLRITQQNSERSVLPKRFNNSFKVTLNNALSIAHAFQMHDGDGNSLLGFYDEKNKLSRNPELIDISINATIKNPELRNPKHIACILATAVLVAEQMLLEQLLKSACHHGNEGDHTKFLRKILGNDELYSTLIHLANSKPKNQNGPLLGLQYPHCDDLVKLLRESLWGKNINLIDIIKTLSAGQHPDLDTSNSDIADALLKLLSIGEALQSFEATSVHQHHSRGINAGVILVIERLCEKLYTDLKKQGRLNIEVSTEKAEHSSAQVSHHSETMEDGGMCPYLRGQNHSLERTQPPVTVSRQARSSCNFFSKKTMAAVVAGTAVIIGYSLSNII